LLDNRKVNLKMGEVEFGIIFTDVFAKHFFLELLEFNTEV